MVMPTRIVVEATMTKPHLKKKIPAPRAESSRRDTRPLKFVPLNADLCRYVAAHRSGAQDSVLDDLRAETEKLGSISEMLISREQGNLLTLLTAALDARSAVEVGTFTGYSAICMARGLPAEGRLLCIDINEDWTAIARRYWQRAGLQDRIELRLGGGQVELARLPANARFDIAFIDADKRGYDLYYELVLPHVRRNGLVVFDNMLQHGRVLAPEDPSAKAIDALNKKLSADPRVQCVLLTVADGLMLCRKL